MASRSASPSRPGRDQLSRRNARLVGGSGFILAAALPPLLWHRAIEAIATDFRFEFEYLITGWTAWTLIALGLLFFVPVVLSIGRDPSSRFYPRSRQAYSGWGVVLYVLGVALATQVGQIADGYAAL